VATPTQQHMVLHGGKDHATYTGNKIKIGDVIRISGSDSNDGIFTVLDIVDKGTSTIAFTESSTGDGVQDGSSTIQHTADGRIVAGLAVSGTGIPSNSYVRSITDGTHFVLGDSVTPDGGSAVNGTADGTPTLTFAGGDDIAYVLKGRGITTENDTDAAVTIEVQRAPGDKLLAFGNADEVSSATRGIDVWSYNASTTDSTSPSLSENDGWSQSSINPTWSGNDAKYIFHFADEALRACNINESNSSIIKWYGYIQRNQFGLDEGLSFNEWQEHSNILSPPVNKAGVAFGYLSTSHTATTVANYYQTNSSITRGVKYLLRGTDSAGDNVGDLEANGGGSTIVAATTSIAIQNANDDVVVDQLFPGDIITIGEALAAVALTEVLFVEKPALATSTIEFERGYGGTTAADIADTATPVVARGIGFNLGVSEDSTAGLWPSNTWEFYQTFIYDGDQESLPVIFGDGASAVAASYFGSSAVGPSVTSLTAGNKKLKLSVYADTAYSGRITGGRIYIREKGSEDPLTLLVDIDIVKGVRTSLLDDHSSWSLNTSGVAGINSVSLLSEGPNIDTYSSLNGFSHEEGFISIGAQGEIYKSSCIGGRRTFIANVKIKNKNGELIKHGDRIMYSEINKFDTFLESNTIDVSKGDFGEYVALHAYADRLLAFKHNLLHIINIGSPNPVAWFLESTTRYAGASYPFSVTKTEFGVAWVNEFGCYLYDGQKVSNLIESKIPTGNSTNTTDTGWNKFVSGTANLKDVMIGYDSISNSLIILRSPDDGTDNSNNCFVYCFNTGGWTYNTNMFTDSETYTNFTTDWNNNLMVGYQADADSISFQKYLQVASGQGSQVLITRDIDFGESALKKKIYKIIVTYKSTADQTTPFEYAIDGKKTWTNFTGDMSATFSGGSALNDANHIDAVDIPIAVDDGSLYKSGDVVLIGTEQMLVSSISGNTLTCVRGYNGSTAATHNDNATITILKWDVGTFTISTPVTCQSVQFKFNPPTSAIIEINDVSVEYRALSRSVVT
jgi:hypothetical protein